MNLSWSTSPEDEFQAPDGAWYYSFRAIVLDSWLLWRDALPPELALRQQLSQPVSDNITALARRLHCFHQSLPDYRQLTDSPFVVTRWWDPSDEDPFWNQGRSCLFRLKNYVSTDLVRGITKKTPLIIRPVTSRFVEVHLPDSITD
jgi:hypothetical protein